MSCLNQASNEKKKFITEAIFMFQVQIVFESRNSDTARIYTSCNYYKNYYRKNIEKNISQFRL